MFRKLVSSTLVVALTVLLGTTSTFAVKPPPTTNQTPVVTTFDVAANSASPVPVLTFTATDADGDQTITGYLITETSAKPSANAGGWAPTAPTQYVTSSVGLLTLYAWAKDDKDAVSDSSSDSVTIPPPPINADTLDGKHASEFAAAVHDHDGVYQKKYANVVVVAKSGGDFADPIAGINSITDASATNPYLLKIMPGVYDLGSSALDMKEYVDIEGSGEKVTIIKGALGANGGWPFPALIQGANNAELRLLTVDNAATTGGQSCAIANWSTSPSLRQVTANVSGMNVSYRYGVVNYYSSVTMTNVTATSSGGNHSWGVYNYYSSPTMTNVSATALSGGMDNAAVLNNYSAPTMINVTAEAWGGSNYDRGVYNYSSSPKMFNVVATGSGPGQSSYGMYNENDGAGTIVTADHCTFEGSTYSVWNASGQILRIGASKLVGPANPDGTWACAAAYNGDYMPLNSACQ